MKKIFNNTFNFKKESNEWDIIEKFHIEGITDSNNDNNEKYCYYLSPFGIKNDEKIIVLQDWFNKRKEIFYPTFSNTNIVVVNELPENIQKNGELFKKFYKKYLEQYNYKKDMEKMEYDIKFININTNELKNILSTIYFTKEILPNVENSLFYKLLDYVITKYNNKCFVRCEKLSPKNDSGKKHIKILQ